MKHPVDTSRWGEFVVGELFDNVTRGTRLKKSDRKSGPTPLVTAGSFYFASKIIPSCVIVLRQQHNKGKEFALFVTAILNATLKGYTFRNRATKNKILSTKIKLPVDKNGEIDYNKIKSAMGDILDIAENRLNDLKEIF